MSLRKVKMKVARTCLTLCDPMDYSVNGNLQARILEWVVIPFYRVSSQARDWTQASSITGRFFTSWQGKPKNTGVGSLSLLQQIFLTHELNWNILHCRLILSQLNYRETLALFAQTLSSCPSTNIFIFPTVIKYFTFKVFFSIMKV